jgi:DNA-binding GntR family transcriptional regulator
MTRRRLEAMGGATARGMEDAGSDVTRVVAAVRLEIEQGRLVSNQRLVEADLAERFAASRGTVRSALLELANEGIVERSRYQGARVRTVSVEQAIEITEVRAVIEALCAAKAAARRDPAVTRDLRAIMERMRAAVAVGDLLGYSRLNRSLHARIVEASLHATAAIELERLRVQGVRHQFRLATLPGRALVSLEEHQAIVDAIAAGDAEDARRAVRAHLDGVTAALRSTEEPGSDLASGGSNHD